jgi:hypothetical protein
MELKTIDDIKKEIGKKVKFGKGDNVSENLKALDVLEGTITKVVSSWEHTKDGDKCMSWNANVDVVDPKDGGLHHLTSNKVFSLDEKNNTIVNIKVIEEIATLEAKIVELEASMVEVIEEEIL